MQKFEGTVITDNGLNLLTTVNGGGDKIQYTKAVLASDDFTQASATAIQKITDLKIKMSSSISINSRINDTINLSASFTNETITEDFDFYCIGWYAKGMKDSTEYLIAVSPSTVKQTMPAGSNNAATAAISPKYAMTLSRSAEVVVNTNPAGSVTKEYVDNQVNALIAEGIINNGSIVSTTDDCNKMITTSYHLVKGSLPLNAPDGFSTNGQIIVYGNIDTTDGVTQLAYDDINGASYVRSYNPTNNQWSTWDLIITKSQLNAVLPTDIARTGETNEFKAKNTFDVDPVNKDGNSYGLAKDIDTKVTDNGDNSIEINKQAVTPVRDNKDGSIIVNGKTFAPADDSKVVHTADMRKPASDVAGIEEVNTKQDKIGYTPADDSKIVHNSGDETIGGTKTFTNPIKGTIDGITYRYSAQGDDLDTSYMNDSVVFVGTNKVANAPAGTSGTWAIIRNYNSNATNGAQSYYDTNNGVLYFRTRNNSTEYSPWIQVADDSKVVHTADMRKSPSDVVGLEDVPQALVKTALIDKTDLNTVTTSGIYPFNGVHLVNSTNTDMHWGYLEVVSQGEIVCQTIYDDYAPNTCFKRKQVGSPAIWTTWIKLADDSKVAHLSGANNFDTTPTVNNNPLLLASSLPSDLARLSQDANFTGKLQKNGKDVATLDQVGSMIKPSSANTQDSALSDSKNDTSSYFTWE